MKREAFDIPSTSMLGEHEKKYLQRVLILKLDTVASKIDYITHLSS